MGSAPPRFRPFPVLLVLGLVLASRPAAADAEDRSTLLGTARAFHAAVESGELARIAAFGCTPKGPFTESEMREAAKSVLGSLKKMRGRAWEFGRESVVKDVPGAQRLEVKTSPSDALLLTGLVFGGRWYLLSVDDLQPDRFTPREPPLVDPGPTLQPAPPVDTALESAVKEVVKAMSRLPTPGDDASSWLLWRRHGMGALPATLVGDLPEMLKKLRAAGGSPPTIEITATGGTAPNRHARATVAWWPLAWTLLLIESEGWKVVRADPGEHQMARPVPPEIAEATGAAAAAEAVVASIDAADAKGFAARSVDLSGASPRRPSADDVKAQMDTLHARYGGRPHKVGAPMARMVSGKLGFTVPVLFGDLEDLLQLVIVHEGDTWLLASVSEGSAADFVERTPPR